jgi:hypothetical protein
MSKQHDKLHEQTLKHNRCELSGECESVTEAKRRNLAEYQKQYRLCKKLEKESVSTQHDTKVGIASSKCATEILYFTVSFVCYRIDCCYHVIMTSWGSGFSCYKVLTEVRIF